MWGTNANTPVDRDWGPTYEHVWASVGRQSLRLAQHTARGLGTEVCGLLKEADLGCVGGRTAEGDHDR